MASVPHPLKATEDLFKQLQEVFQSESCQNLTAIVTENSELRKRIGNLEITNNTILESMERLKQELKLSLEKTTNMSTEVETLRAEKDKIAGTLKEHKSSAEEKSKQFQDKIAEVSSLKSELKKEEANNQRLKKLQEEKDRIIKRTESDKTKAETELTVLRSTLSTTSKRLKTFEQLQLKLEKPQKDQLCRSLHGIFESLDTLARNSFGELDESMMAQPENWTAISKHDAVEDRIPLSPTNTANARDMRRAALLTMCAVALEEHVFQSSHLLRPDKQLNELSQILDDMAEDNPEKEALIRSILLSIQYERLKTEPDLKYACVQSAMNAVLECVCPLLSPEKQVVFEAALGKIFVEACELWRHVQGLENKIIPVMVVDDDDIEDWILVPAKNESPAKKSSQSPNGIVRNAGEFSKAVKQPQANKIKVAKEDIEVFLWPAFTISEGEKITLLMKGYAIHTSELAAPREEQIKAQLQGPRRTARQNSRSTRRRSSVSQASKPTVGQADNGGRRAFLSERGVGGSSVAFKQDA